MPRSITRRKFLESATLVAGAAIRSAETESHVRRDYAAGAPLEEFAYGSGCCCPVNCMTEQLQHCVSVLMGLMKTAC